MNTLKNLLQTQKPMLDERDEQGRIPQQMLGTRIPKELHHRLKVHAVEHNQTMTQVITAAVENYLDQHK